MAFWDSRNIRDTREARLSARLDRVERHNEERDSVAKYHRDLNLMSTQYRNLEEIQSNVNYRGTRESRLIELERAKSKEELQLRQAKLSALFAKENEKYFIEMNMLAKQDQNNDPWNIQNLKQQIEQLNLRRLETEESLKQSNLHNLHHNVNVPYVKERESRALEKEVIADMEQQRKQLEKITLQRRAEEEEKKGNLEELRNHAYESAKSAEIEKQQHSKTYQEFVQHHASLLEHNSDQRSKLNESLKALQSCENELEKIMTKHKQSKEIQRQCEQKVAMFRLSKERLRKMTGEKKRGMSLDLTTVTALQCMKTNFNASLDIEEASRTKKEIENQFAGESEREQEMQFMFEEEAKRLWATREREWIEKSNYRENLLKNLVIHIKAQIRTKMDEYTASQRDLNEIRHKLVQEFAEENERQNEQEKELTDKREYFSQKVKDLDAKLTKVNPKYAMLNIKH